jgi:adenylate kinase
VSIYSDVKNFSEMSRLPNILITGTPGTGKTTTSQLTAERIGLRHINVGDIVKAKACHEGKDEDFDSYILDEEKLVDELEEVVSLGGCIIDFHSPEIFPEDWFDLILVLRTNTEQLYDRLVMRGYNDRKRDENMECEIMQVVLDAVQENFEGNVIVELQSNTVDDMESNISRIEQWYADWRSNNYVN